jgi:hypothetical protein
MYAAGRENFAAGNIAFNSNTIRLVGVDHADDTPVPATDDALNDIGAPARVFTSNALASKTNVGGTLDADDVLVSAVSGDQFESITLYKDSGVESTSYLIAYWDVVTGLPYTPDGSDLLIIWGTKILTI